MKSMLFYLVTNLIFLPTDLELLIQTLNIDSIFMKLIWSRFSDFYVTIYFILHKWLQTDKKMSKVRKKNNVRKIDVLIQKVVHSYFLSALPLSSNFLSNI